MDTQDRHVAKHLLDDTDSFHHIAQNTQKKRSGRTWPRDSFEQKPSLCLHKCSVAQIYERYGWSEGYLQCGFGHVSPTS
jgi:hypothetical protein